MNKISVVFTFFIILSSLVTLAILFPFLIGLLMLGIIFGGLGSSFLVFHAIMHKLHFCPLCGVFPRRSHSETTA